MGHPDSCRAKRKSRMTNIRVGLMRRGCGKDNFFYLRPVLQRFRDGPLRLSQLFACDFQSRRSDTGAAHSQFLLHKLNELDELRNGVHAQKRQEPAVKLEGIFGLAFISEIEE